MFEEASSSLPSMWASVNSWFTPTVLFIFLNLMICTIAISSSSITTKNHHGHGRQTHHQSQPTISAIEKEKPPESNSHSREERPKVDRSPPVLRRMNSFNLDDYISQEPYQSESPDEERINYSHSPDSQMNRKKFNTNSSGGEISTRLPRKFKKSASSKSAFSHFVEDNIVEARRPTTVKEREPKPMEVDDEVDAKADDFNNKFKQQLKLQRIDSIVRYKEMVSRGNEKGNFQSLG